MVFEDRGVEYSSCRDAESLNLEYERVRNGSGREGKITPERYCDIISFLYFKQKAIPRGVGHVSHTSMKSPRSSSASAASVVSARRFAAGSSASQLVLQEL